MVTNTVTIIFIVTITFIVSFGFGVIIGLLWGKQITNDALVQSGVIPNEYLSEEARRTFEKIEESLKRKPSTRIKKTVQDIEDRYDLGGSE
jgi:MFS superfamily sulfate permease-like transporter